MTRLQTCLSLLLATVAKAAVVLQWNPHWECFTKHPACKTAAEASLSQLLTENDVDFANVVELEDESYRPPEGFASISTEDLCKADITALFYNTKRWKVLDDYVDDPRDAVTCLAADGRPAIVRLFASVGDDSLRVLVVGAHFPHGQFDYSPLTKIMTKFMESSNACSTIFLADTNKNAVVTNQKIFEGLQVPGASAAAGTEPLKTCCAHDGFTYSFDRIITNAGSDVQTTLLHDPLPGWVVSTSSFHKGVLGRFELQPVQCPPFAGTTTTTTTTTTLTSSDSGTTSTSAEISGSGEGGLPPWAWLLLAGGLLLVVAAVVVVYLRQRLRDARDIVRVRTPMEVEVSGNWSSN
eukprot:TRINITY_DN52529_c0_g1_i1.p1 TRINITY_DN52529_c0_g1~~TRINITY_DN52529_c0_g1_i1.p1  ORF type:complete len:352 (-),score=62.68 TRINITY_DN52529_c0_g1_i1:2-1057(-)